MRKNVKVAIFNTVIVAIFALPVCFAAYHSSHPLTIQQLQAKYVKKVDVKHDAGIMVIEYRDGTLGFVPRDVPLYFRDGHLQGMVLDIKTKKWRVK